MQQASATSPEARPTEAIDAAEFYGTYFPLVYSYFRRRVSDSESAEDLTSTTFERILGALPRFAPQGDAETATRVWVYRIAGNVYKNSLRGQKRESDRQQAWIEGWTSSNDESGSADLGLALGAAVAELEADDRNVLGLRFWDGLTAREIADVVGCSQREVYTTLERCMRQLRRQLSPQDEEAHGARSNGSGLEHDEWGQPPGRSRQPHGAERDGSRRQPDAVGAGTAPTAAGHG